MQLYRLEVLETWRRVAYVQAKDEEEAMLFAKGEGEGERGPLWRSADRVKDQIDAEDYIRVIPVDEEEPEFWGSDIDSEDLADYDAGDLDLLLDEEAAAPEAVDVCPHAEWLLRRIAGHKALLGSQRARIRDYILTEARDRPAKYYEECAAALDLLVTLMCLTEKYEDFTGQRAKIVNDICSEVGPNYFVEIGSR